MFGITNEISIVDYDCDWVDHDKILHSTANIQKCEVNA